MKSPSPQPQLPLTFKLPPPGLPSLPLPPPRLPFTADLHYISPPPPTTANPAHRHPSLDYTISRDLTVGALAWPPVRLPRTAFSAASTTGASRGAMTPKSAAPTTATVAARYISPEATLPPALIAPAACPTQSESRGARAACPSWCRPCRRRRPRAPPLHPPRRRFRPLLRPGWCGATSTDNSKKININQGRNGAISHVCMHI
ncbi:hypothetical protein CDL15_Pgr015220 [Punica granatum]|uniref:Uncharacterized protein n=1 Tax=Punica granatum TaxID=22663 RepID=A0A218VZ75_PUNGR|nr:hypothetical protein CDL15_Pgr015220 [Punica granatum]